MLIFENSKWEDEEYTDWGIDDGEECDWRLEAQNEFDLGESEVRREPKSALRRVQHCIEIIDGSEERSEALSIGETGLRLRALRIALRLKVRCQSLEGFSAMFERVLQHSECVHSDCVELWKVIDDGTVETDIGCEQLQAFFEASCKLFRGLRRTTVREVNQRSFDIQKAADWIEHQTDAFRCGLCLARVFYEKRLLGPCTKIVECLQQNETYDKPVHPVIDNEVVFEVFFGFNHMAEMIALMNAFHNSSVVKRVSGLGRWKQYITPYVLEVEMMRLCEVECKEQLDEWNLRHFANLTWTIVKTEPMPYATETQLRNLVIDTIRRKEIEGIHYPPKRWLKLCPSRFGEAVKSEYPLLWSWRHRHANFSDGLRRFADY